MLQIAIATLPHSTDPLITLTGDANLAEVDRLQLDLRRIGSAHPRRVVIDLSACTFMASLALGTLVEFTSGVKPRDGRVAVAGAAGMLLDAIKRSRLDTLFVMAESVADATSRLQQLVPVTVAPAASAQRA
jgi:anti-anti-sigma factor